MRHSPPVCCPVLGFFLLPLVTGCATPSEVSLTFGPTATPPLVEHVAAWDPNDAEASKKVYSHLFSSDGQVLLTKGAGGDLSHHRGIFVGYNRVRHGEQRLDFWHCPLDGAGVGPTIRHVRDLTEMELADPLLPNDETEAFCAEFPDARLQVFGAEAQWVAPDGTVWVDERRVVRAAARRGVVTCDVDVTLTARVGDLELGGDPHHAGLQIRLANEVHDRKAETRYFHAEGAGELGNDVWERCAWAAAYVEIGGRRFLIQHIDHPANPEGRYSTRDYGRFGSCANVSLKQGESARLRCRIVVTEDPVAPDSSWPSALEALAHAYRVGR